MPGLNLDFFHRPLAVIFAPFQTLFDFLLRYTSVGLFFQRLRALTLLPPNSRSDPDAS